MSQYGASRSGVDMPSRFRATSDMLLEAHAMPLEPQYQPLVPFFPPNVVSGSQSALVAGSEEDEGKFKLYPERLDLSFYQGDDVLIPLEFQDNGKDMSTNWEWTAQIRARHRYYAVHVNDFIIHTEYTPPDGLLDGYTTVSLILPRAYNRWRSTYFWELASESPYDGPDYEGAPLTQVKTWLYGLVTIVPRLTATDTLPLVGAPPSYLITVTPQGYVVGPNGRVP